MCITISHTLEADLLVVGAGIGGLSATVEANAKGLRPLLISKGQIGSGASYFPLKATLGIQITGENDQANFAEDIERVAQGMNNPTIVNAYIEDSPKAIELLARIGFDAWRRNDNRPACFARYPRPIYLIKDWKQAAANAKQILFEKQIRYYENATLLAIATVDNQVQGALFSHQTSGEMHYLFCKTSQLILATGGIAGLYKDNLYPADVIGSSHYLAELAGARLTNLEFIQFIPAFVEPKYKVLFGEHTLKYVEKVTDSKGGDLFPQLSHSQFQQMMTERSSYAPFSVDFDCFTFDLVMMKHLLENPAEKGVYLHYSPALYQDDTEFFTVYLDWLKQKVGIDLLKDWVAIKPFAHSCNGGIVIDEHAQTAVKGLFAVGEVASGIEGANRLGGNSVGGCLVFAKRAVKQILQNLAQERPLVPLEIAQQQVLELLHSLKPPKADKMLIASQVLSEIRENMAMFANVYRTAENLARLADTLQDLEQRFDPLAHLNFQGLEVYYALKTAQRIVQAMQARTVSLGAHFRA